MLFLTTVQNIVKRSLFVTGWLLLLVVVPVQCADIWKQIDRQGQEGKAPSDMLPAWPGWTAELDDRGRQIRTMRLKDGSLLEVEPPFGPSCEDRVKIKSGNRYGYVDASGKVVIKPSYENVEYFYNGLNEVQVKKGTPWQVIDKSGLVRYTLPSDLAPDVSSHFWGVSKEGLLPVRRGDHEDGVYDLAKGKFYSVGDYTVISEFSEGLAVFNPVSSMLTGFLDTNGRIVIAPKFRYADSFHEGLAAVLEGDHWCYIDKTGSVVIRLPDNCSTAERFSEGLAAVALGGEEKTPEFLHVRDGAKWGFIDTSGKVVVPPQFYVDATYGLAGNRPSFKEGLAPVAVGDDVHHRYGYIDRTGAWVIQPRFKKAGGFSNGKARVCFGQTGFSKEEWQKKWDRYYVDRDLQFQLFLKQYGLLKMNRKQVNELLGKPDHRYLDSDIYALMTGPCGNSYMAVEIRYENNDVTKYRYRSLFRHDKWIDVSLVKSE